MNFGGGESSSPSSLTTELRFALKLEFLLPSLFKLEFVQRKIEISFNSS